MGRQAAAGAGAFFQTQAGRRRPVAVVSGQSRAAWLHSRQVTIPATTKLHIPMYPMMTPLELV